MVTELPTDIYLNVFQFIAHGHNGKYGDKIPALFITKSYSIQDFLVYSAVNGDRN